MTEMSFTFQLITSDRRYIAFAHLGMSNQKQQNGRRLFTHRTEPLYRLTAARRETENSSCVLA